MKPLDHLTSAFECLWEAKVYLLKTAEGADEDLGAKLRVAVAEVAAARDRVEKLLIEVQAKRPPDPGPRPE